MPRRPNAGRKEIKIDWKVVDGYLASGCTGTEIAAQLGFFPDTLYRRCVSEKKKQFADYAAEKRQKGDLMLKAKQFGVAMGGNTTMLVWLGKQRLNQSEQPKSKEEFNGNLANLLDALHLINNKDEFETLIKKAKEDKKQPKTEEELK